jgi:LL-diaminopimelate aminotransferase
MFPAGHSTQEWPAGNEKIQLSASPSEYRSNRDRQPAHKNSLPPLDLSVEKRFIPQRGLCPDTGRIPDERQFDIAKGEFLPLSGKCDEQQLRFDVERIGSDPAMIKKLVLEKADRLYHLPPFLDDFLPRKKERKKMLGHDILDLARFDWPSLPAEGKAQNGIRAATEAEISGLAEKTAAWYRNRYGGKVNPAKEIFVGHSIRQILNLLALAFVNPGDMLLIPDPGVWHYRAAAVLASAETIPYHLSERNRFKPALNSISVSVARTARGMILNSPHNPSGAVLAKEDLEEILHLAGRENLLLILDQAFDGFIDGGNPASLFTIPGGRKSAIELYSYGYNFGRPQPSCAFAIAQPAIIVALKRLARIFGLGLSHYLIESAAEACDAPDDEMEKLKNKYAHNRKMVDQLCAKLRLIPTEFRVGPFYWAKLPGRKQSRRFCRLLYLKAGILAVPGFAFGENGEGYIRFSLTGKPEAYEKAIEATGMLFQPTKSRKASHG